MTKLADYLSKHSLTDLAFSEKVGCERSMITRIKAGKVTPSLRLAASIEAATKGKVAAVSLIAVSAPESAAA